MEKYAPILACSSFEVYGISISPTICLFSPPLEPSPEDILRISSYRFSRLQKTNSGTISLENIIAAIDWFVVSEMRFIATVPLVFPCPANAIKTEFAGIILALELFSPSTEILLSVYVMYFLCTSPDDNQGISFGCQYFSIPVLGVPPAQISATSETFRCSQAYVFYGISHKFLWKP